MTIASTVNKILYAGTGALVAFPYPFKIFASSDLVVIRRAADGVETTLALYTDYTVSGAGSDAGGTVTLIGLQAASPPSTSEKLLIKRVVPLTQQAKWEENDDFPAVVINNAMDRVVCQIQQQQEQIDRSLKVGATSTLGTVIDPVSIATDAALAASNAAAAAASAAQAAASALSVDLPVITSADAGKSLTVSDAGEWQASTVSSSGSDLYLVDNYNCLMY